MYNTNNHVTISQGDSEPVAVASVEKRVRITYIVCVMVNRKRMKEMDNNEENGKLLLLVQADE